MSEETLIRMSQQIGELNGRLAASLDAQNKTNEALFKLAEGNDKRLKELESAKSKVIGAVIASGVSGSGIGAFLAKLMGTGHGP